MISFDPYDKLKEECGIFGIYSQENEDVSSLIYKGLHALQHRGQDGAGILVHSEKENPFNLYKNIGLVQNVFNKEIIKNLKGHFGIGHVRYSTSGKNDVKNLQPFFVEKTKFGKVAVAHNGNLTNADILKKEIKTNHNIVFNSTSDSEIFLKLIEISKEETLEKAILESLKKVKGAYALLFLTEEKIIAITDPFGIRPLSLGKINGKESYCFASESCAFDSVDASLIRSIKNDEYLILDKNGISFHKINDRNNSKKAFCIFEYIYLARPDSIIDEMNVYKIRKAIGRQLALNYPIKADMVVPVPDSGIPIALGYAESSKIPFEMAIMRSHYSGRSFIEKKNKNRIKITKEKLKIIKSISKGKSIILIDDSIVRGNVSKNIIDSFYEKGAKEVHLIIGSPMFISPCYYGIDIANKNELIANICNRDIKKIKEYISCDSLYYLKLESLLNVFGEFKKDSFCSSCFTGNYPIT